MIILNAKVVFVIESKHVHCYHFPWFAWNVMINKFLFWLGLLKIKACRTVFYMVLIICIHTYAINRFACQEFSSFSVHVVNMNLSTCCCNAFGITICLPFMTTPSITAMSSLNIQYVLMSYGS